MQLKILSSIVLTSLISGSALAQSMGSMPSMPDGETAGSFERPMGPEACGEMEVWDFSMGMCMPHAMKDMPMRMAMLNYNSFLVQTFEEGPRGRSTLTIPNMFMVDVGTTVGDRQFINLDFMGTVERWTYPDGGYPELLQVGEENANHQPFVDAQHPHSSPIMGLTLSDTISLGDGKDHAKIWFSPRGQSTDGPVAFMHRPTGMINPDAPLGHHIGQDVGHISSTVLGTSVRLSNTTIEASTFNGTEPEPTKIDLPIAPFNSYAVRAIHEFTPQTYAMASFAFVKDPEPHDSDLDHVWRYSASVYNERSFDGGWMLHSAFIYGLINGYDKVGALNSFSEELWLHKENKNFWSRVEYLQRTPSELQVSSTNPGDPRRVTAATLGYTHRIVNFDDGALGVGASVTKDFLPSEFQGTYGGNPLTAKVFLQLGGMKMCMPK